MASWKITSRIWERIHIDFLEKYGHHILIVVDTHSRWLDLHLMKKGTNAENTIEKLRESFTYFGLPEQIVSDNGTPFNGAMYKIFRAANNILCTFTSPYNPCSNGAVEKQVNTVKQNLVKQVFEQNKSTMLKMSHAIQNFLFNTK